ncbi:WhiB family transcriptional regulator (plasmid) [Nonomuraea sp. CA-143628]|uniref:WhiB family transcriptional regulator n=1 Tax=Nonomuraea sp. CA-143628 TaxID=3239997 RepID=UPI003D9266E5
MPSARHNIKPRGSNGWRWHAACRGEDPVLFFGREGEKSSAAPAREAKATAFCKAYCQVIDECLDWALTAGEIGVWGGTTKEQRKSLKRRQQRSGSRAAPPPEPRPEPAAAEKLCPSCRDVKPVAEFGRDTTRRDGLHSTCKECTNTAQARRRAGAVA